MAKEKEKWLDSKEQARWAKAHTFNAKIHRLFWNLQVNSLLDLVLADKKMKAQNIESMGDLLLAISKSPNTAAYIATGLQHISPASSDKLIELCDPFHLKRENLRSQIEIEKQELRRARNKSLGNPSFEAIENQQRIVKTINTRLGELQRELDGLPDRNTLPSNLFGFPGMEELIDQGLITYRHKNAPKISKSEPSILPFLTDAGKKVIDTTMRLSLDIEYVLKTGGQVSKALITSLHTQAQESYRECTKS